ncbi:hypothetical protein HQ529_03530 [Candidatus Woesearchaeota archaeon]|nr:hypothetical protein [Candidatus Woesearchaeota archaeon]
MEKDINEVKELLENTARDSDLKVSGEIVTLKTKEQREADKEIDNWKETKKDYIPIKEFDTAHELINCLLRTPQFNGLILHGEGGVGKTVLTLNTIKSELKANEWDYMNGYTTPLSLAEFLYKNRNKKVIIIDDTEGIFNNHLSMSLIKGGLWEVDGKRVITYSTKSDKTDIPDQFVVNFKIIFLCNHIPNENDSSTRAMISRTIPYMVKFTFKEKMDICKTFVEKDPTLTPEKKKRVIELLEKNVTETTRDFNFRTLRKLLSFVEYNDAKAEELFRATTEVDEMKEAYFKSVKVSKVVKEQRQHFMKLTGRSARTFHYVKKSVVAKMQSDKDVGATTPNK